MTWDKYSATYSRIKCARLDLIQYKLVVHIIYIPIYSIRVNSCDMITSGEQTNLVSRTVFIWGTCKLDFAGHLREQT